ncbi:YsnF/AvaK domain-containing protein, partial [Agrobacterium pusense]
AGREEVIPVVEEKLRVGKRDLNHGRVRVRSYVVENPVSEQVSLRDENVSIERRTVDRPVTETENAFVDRTIEAEEHHEEAIVSKDARVVEEIALRKTAEQREETISDSVRRTEVEVEDERSDRIVRKGVD